jgi:hypothetical protein
MTSEALRTDSGRRSPRGAGAERLAPQGRERS